LDEMNPKVQQEELIPNFQSLTLTEKDQKEAVTIPCPDSKVTSTEPEKITCDICKLAVRSAS